MVRLQKPRKKKLPAEKKKEKRAYKGAKTVAQGGSKMRIAVKRETTVRYKTTDGLSIMVPEKDLMETLYVDHCIRRPFPISRFWSAPLGVGVAGEDHDDQPWRTLILSFLSLCQRQNV
jgi:hypothetical protein